MEQFKQKQKQKKESLMIVISNKYSMLNIMFFVFYLFFILSCQNNQQQSTFFDFELKKINYSENTKNKRSLLLRRVSNEHPNKQIIFWLIDNYCEEFSQASADIEGFNNNHLIQTAYGFKTDSSNVLLTLFFCSSKENTMKVLKTNEFPLFFNESFDTLGNVIYMVEGKDSISTKKLFCWFKKEGLKKYKLTSQ